MKKPRIEVPAGEGLPYRRARGHRPELAGALNDLHAAAMALSSLDAITTELVRLRCARYHDCDT